MDTSDPWITFDSEGVCNHCLSYDAAMARLGDAAARKAKLESMVSHLKTQGRGKDYDCIMGLSGGVDSSYLAWYAVKELGLRPLMVHVDAGWNSELAVNNIQNIVQRLGLDLHTKVINWEEIRDLQRAYFLSGLANQDVPQDHAFFAALYNEARAFGIKDIVTGGNLQTESILPSAWGHDAMDSTNILAIHKKFGRVKLREFPIHSNWQRFFYKRFINPMRTHRPLDCIDYNKDHAKDFLKSELGWRDYGGKHYESIFTKFFQAHYLPTKFGYDKRLAHLSSLIVSGQMTKDEAKAELQRPLYDLTELEQDRIYWIKKIGLTIEEYNRVMVEKPGFYADYPNSEALRLRLRKVAQMGSATLRALGLRKK
ncbi:WbuX, N-acetyl sugar amidotransferase [Paracoccaceae bacterium]